MGLPSSRRRFKLGKRVNASGRFVSLLLKRKLNGAEEVFSFFFYFFWRRRTRKKLKRIRKLKI